MSKIQILDPVTIDKIAAGEVVERPASIVKELSENSIDAGATAVTVEIEEGGISYIRIADNGCGIPKEEVPSAFLRHSTSKIRSVDDLLHIAFPGIPWRSALQYRCRLPGGNDHKDSGRDLWDTLPDRGWKRGGSGGYGCKGRHHLYRPSAFL